MKKTIFYLFGLFTVLMLTCVSCGDDTPDKKTEITEPIEPGEGEVLFGEEQTLSAAAKELTVVFMATQSWNMSASTSWLTLSSKNGGTGLQTITITADANTDVYKERIGILTLQFNDHTTQTMKIIQNPVEKQIKMDLNSINFEYSRYTIEFSAIVKMVSNFEWKIKSFPAWIEEPILDGTIYTNLKDSTGITVRLIKDKLTIDALEDSIVFSDPKDAANTTIAKLNLKFDGMGLSSITWERDALQRTDLSEDLGEGLLFKATIGGNDGIKYKNDNYVVTPTSGYPISVDYLDFYVKTPKKFAYTTIEEAKQYFDIFVLCSSANVAYPLNLEAPVKIELTGAEQNDVNEDYVRKYWRLSFTEENLNCLRQKYLLYVLPKGERERLFKADGSFDKVNYEYEGKLFSRRGGALTDPTFRVEGLNSDIIYQKPSITLPNGVVKPGEKITGEGAYIGKGKSLKIEIYANDPNVLSQSRICLKDGESVQKISWLVVNYTLDPNDSKHATIKLSYKSMEDNSASYCQLKIVFSGDAYLGSNELRIQDDILIVRQDN